VKEGQNTAQEVDFYLCGGHYGLLLPTLWKRGYWNASKRAKNRQKEAIFTIYSGRTPIYTM